MAGFYHWLWRLAPANPIVVRIVQGGSRRIRHLWIRMAYLGLLVLLVLTPMLFGGVLTGQQTLTDLAKIGSSVFQLVSYGQVIFICLLAPLFMAGAIAAEQSGKTYSILMTTPLTNLQIVLGSLLGRLFFVLALLASGLPLFSVLLIFGGVPIQAVFVSFAVAGLSALMMGSVAVTLAVLRAGGRKAVFIFVISIAAYLVLGYALDQFVLRQAAPIVPGGTTWLTPLHPILVLTASFNSSEYRVPSPDELSAYSVPAQFYLGRPLAAFATLTGLCSALLVGWSSLRVRAVGELEGRGGLKMVIARWLRLSIGENRHPPRDVWANSIAWREANTRGNGAAAVLLRWSYVALGLAAAATLIAFYHAGSLPPVYNPATGQNDAAYTFRLVLMVLLLAELVIVVLVAIYISAGSVSREREDGTLDLLLTTPVTQKQYIWGKLRGLVSFLAMLLAVPVLTLAMAGAYTLAGQWLQWPGVMMSVAPPNLTGVKMNVPLVLPEAPLLLALVLVPYISLCVMVGMNWSLKSRGVLGAIAGSVGVLGALMLVTGFCGWSAAASIPFIGPAINVFSPTTSLVMIVNPWENISDFAENTVYGRFTLALSSAVAVLGYGLVIYALLTGMVKGFDFTVRKLSGAGA